MTKTTRHPLAAKDKIYTSIDAKSDLLYDNPKKNYGNLVSESNNRTVFQHDCDAILYSKSFRRLMRKTQVTYPGTNKNEHTRTRLTHTLEVMQIARSLTIALGLNDDLAEAISLGHDLGHTPFGHEGESFLDKACLGIENEGTSIPSIIQKYNLPDFTFDFKHNYQSARILLFWEGVHYDSDKKHNMPGLNISKQTLEGILKHSKIRRKNKSLLNNQLYKYPEIIINNKNFFQIDYNYAVWSVEGQIVALADEIAQVCHDLDDAIGAEYRVKQQLYGELKEFLNSSDNEEYYDALKDQSFIFKKYNPDNPHKKKIIINKDSKDNFHLFISWVIGYLISVSQQEIRKVMNDYCDEKRRYGLPLFPLDKELAGEEVTLGNNKLFKFLKTLENKYIINNIRINRENGKADFILKSIIEAYLNNPKQLPDSLLLRYSYDENINPYVKKILSKSKKKWVSNNNIRYAFDTQWTIKDLELLRNDQVFLRYIWDYVASMTDQYALNEYKMLYLSDPAYNDAF